VLPEISLQFAICEQLAFKFQDKHIPTDVLADFWHRTPNLDDVKHAGFVTSELKKEIKKKEFEKHHKIHSILVYILSCHGC
jgi:hypothetical protein